MHTVPFHPMARRIAFAVALAALLLTGLVARSTPAEAASPVYMDFRSNLDAKGGVQVNLRTRPTVKVLWPNGYVTTVVTPNSKWVILNPDWYRFTLSPTRVYESVSPWRCFTYNRTEIWVNDRLTSTTTATSFGPALLYGGNYYYIRLRYTAGCVT